MAEAFDGKKWQSRPISKSQNALDKYLSKHCFVTEMLQTEAMCDVGLVHGGICATNISKNPKISVSTITDLYVYHTGALKYH